MNEFYNISASKTHEIIIEDTSQGLSTKEALVKLHNEINAAVEEFCKKKVTNYSLIRLLSDAFGHKSYLSSFRWTSLTILIVYIVFLAFAYRSHESTPIRFITVPIEITVIIVACILNIILTLWETYLRHNELPYHTKRALSKLESYSTYVYWEKQNYPHLHSPLSPCITLQWTKRDGAIVNLPWTLLVEGDMIYLRPGQKVPGRCRSLETGKYSEETVLNYGDIYSPYLEGVGEGFTSPKARTPLQEASFLLLETPFLMNLRSLLSEALNRPATLFNKQCYWLLAKAIEFTILPVFIVLVTGVSALRIYYDIWKGHWTEVLLVMPAVTALPLIPIFLPIANVLLNWLGTAAILAAFQQGKEIQSLPTEDPFEGEEIEVCKERIKVKWRDFKSELMSIIKGEQSVPIRTANLIHILASVTVSLFILASVTNLCCVDKKGILSWPNPTAEKLFFLKNRGHDNLGSSNLISSGHSMCVNSEQQTLSNIKSCTTKESECVLMSLTHDHTTAFGLQFDDISWRRYMLSLKPLGLNVLLNTCNPATQMHYTKFCAHITCEAMYNEDLVPVSQRRGSAEYVSKPDIFVDNRGCLCELPKQMGFRSKAQEPFQLQHQLSTFRHVPIDMACKDRLARSLSITKLKFPFPHMVSVVLRDKFSGKLELMAQGTADIILDSCTDYWDGCDISTLTDKDRKKIIDFYHRTSLSAYCTAFSYRPMSCSIKENLTDYYLEIPIDPSHLYQAARIPTPHISTEALFGDTEHTEIEEIVDVEDSFRMQCKQIFIGMVTMQYQAKADMVRMIDELEKSCIRFVHFSKENELRSRVFSEKMGLESGWNCHISLLSDRTRTESGNSSRMGNTPKPSGLNVVPQSIEDLNSPEFSRGRGRSGLEVSRVLSHSAPSAINLDVSQVKFEEDIPCNSKSSSSTSSELLSSNDSKKKFLKNSWHHKGETGVGVMFRDLNEEQQPLTSQDEALQPLQTLRSEDTQSVTSDVTTSSEQSASLNFFDMSNRARLPKGIENIRPHLENVDNVPLLVSLFTDCTPPSTKAMVAIMQEYTEVVALLGSTANMDNMSLFMKADLSIGMDPLHPQVCMREPVFIRPPSSCGPAPMEVAGLLNLLPCSIYFYRDNQISLAHLILKSRHFMQHFMSCFQFWACCSVSISALQVISAIALLPPILSSGDVLWLICVPVPLISISLVFAPTNPGVMNEATGKNKVHLNKETLKYIWLYYACKFVPSIVVVMITTLWLLFSFCHLMVDRSNWKCEYIYPVYNSTSLESWSGWGEELSYSLTVVHKTVVFQLILYFGVISVSFVHRRYQIWRRNPFRNKIWATSVITAMVLQIIYIKLYLGVTYNGEVPGFIAIPIPVWLIMFLWPFLLLLINEAIKRQEIRVNVRYQKRAKLEFGTKLGMNSPF